MSAASALAVDVAHEGRGVEAAFEVPAGGCAAVVGPNGAGKSSLLAMVSGSLRPTRGRVLVGGRDVAALPVWRRKVALLAQRAVLFEHLDVLDNVAFAPRVAGLGAARSRALARQWLARVGASEWARRRPHELSGGQAQRVALAQALAAEPDVLLLDEPFAAVDVPAAAELRALARGLLAGQTCVLVTHDYADVATLADVVVVLDAGRVAQTTGPEGLAADPATEFAARLVGLNRVGSALFPPTAASVVLDPGAPARYRGEVVGVVSHGEGLRALCRVEECVVEVQVGRELAQRLEPGTPVGVSVEEDWSR
ncbi:MAG: ABC transporter ATP-binding protein [Segniliparus sp.]|uniref:ABC transporter ATP-binding protein n=1 Tax=Segniliparus sp. TaxID=2804064 RepID=UPI003F38EA58